MTDRPLCSACGQYCDDAALDRLDADAWAHRNASLVCSTCRATCVVCRRPVLSAADLAVDATTCADCERVAA